MNEYLYIGAVVVLAVIILCVLAFGRVPENDDIDDMSGGEFEDFMAEILHRSGIEVLELTKRSGDFGADIIVMYEGERTAVQCKRYSRPIGVKAVQEAVSSMAYYKCDRSAVITNSTFTRQAQDLAAESGVILWDREAVEDFMRIAENRGGKRTTGRKAKGTMRFHRIVSDESEISIYINKEKHEFFQGKVTVVSVETGECNVSVRCGRKKAEKTINLDEETRDFVVGSEKNKIIFYEIM